MANKRNVDCVDALICSKMPRRDNKPDQLPNGICKPTPLASYSQENSVQYTGSYLAYHLRNQERTDPSGAWSQSQPYLQVAGEPSAQPQPVGDRLHQAEPEAQSPRSTSMKDQLDLVKELMIVRSKWVTFVERQKNLRSDQSRSGVLCPASTGKHNLTGSDLGAGQSCRNVAFPQAVYRSSICCSGVGCSLQNSDHFHRRGQETEWRMPTPVTSRCLIANNDHLLHNQQYGNSLSKNKLLHHGSNIGQASSVGRITKDAEAQSSLGHGFGPYNGNVLQDPRYSLLPYESANGTVPSHTSMPTFQSPPLHVYSKGQKEQAPFYCDKRTPPKFPIPIQPKVVHSHNATLNAAPYSLLHPRGYRAQPVGCPYPVRGVVGQMPVSNSTFVPQLSPGNPYPPQSESLGYPVQPHLLHNSAPTTGPSIHPNLETVPQPGQLGLQSPSIRNLSAAPQDPASANTPSLDALCCRLRGVGDAQMDTPCYNSLAAPPNKEYIGHPQLISKHSAFQPVLSGKPFKGPFERPAVSLADQRPKDIYTHEFNPSTDISPNCNHGTSAFSKENEITNSMLVDCELGSPPTSYSISPSGRTSEVNFLSAHSSEAHKRLSASSPPMPVINNVFSLAPYRSYLEATGLFFTSCQKCQSDCNKPLSCSCPSESQTNLCGTAAFANADLHEESPMKLTQVIDELQCKDAELKQSNPSVCSGACSKETLSRKKREGGQPNPAASLDQDVNLSPTLGIQNPTPRPIASYQVDNDDPTGKLEMTKADAESVLDLSVKSRSQSVQPQFSASPGRGEEPECMGKELGSTGERSEKLENKGESTRHGGGPRSEVGDTRPAPPSVPCKPGEEINSKEVSNEDKENTAGSVNRKESEAHLESSGATAVKTTTSSCSPLTVALNRCEVLRPAPTRVERSSLSRLPEGPADMNMITVLGSVNPLRLIVPLELVVPDEAKSVLSPTPEVKKSSCETKVHIPSWGEPAQSAGDMHTSFLALHQSLCCMVAQSVAETPAEDLQARLRDFEARSRSKEDPKARSSSKSKNGPRNEASKSQEMWLGYGQVAPTMRKLLSQLETYLFTRMCPFPHVIRAGATFIPIYLVKEKLFSSLKGTAIDQVFQEHKIELRPTTLSEEKKLQNELQLQRCSSRLIKLLSLKQLPQIYPDLLNVLWYSCAKIRLDLPTHVGLDAPVQVCKRMKT
ncbi:uncharacterized protein C15orf39 homolog isoform X2 [Narcine bancroftii]|uniref:uncharacterized protein C15orf39 homolog isoform X2 n=1 Tax=Narcine bancroftii TaxID=1343680 RepID=UPI003830FD8B